MALLEKRTEIYPHYRVHVVPINKFKTISLIVHMRQSIKDENLAKRALMPYVLQSATENLPSAKEIRQHLEQLYGMTLSVDLMKKGDYHVIAFRAEIGHEKFLLTEENILEKAVELLADVILRPKGRIEKAFDPEVVRKEKRSLKQKIQAIYDDKIRYANMRLIEEMFENDPYGQIVYGNLEEIDAIDEHSLFTYYEQALVRDSIDLYVVGDVSHHDIQPLIKKHFTFPPERKEHVHAASQSNLLLHRDAKEVIDEQEVNQGKLNIGYRTNTRFQDEDYSALQVFNGIFGGVSHSKLFINVREKESLAYYASSQIESHKGLLIVMSGIDPANYQLTLAIIREQMEKMKRGDFTDDELLQTKTMLVNQWLESVDDPRGIVNFLYNEIIANRTASLDDMIQGIERVTREDVVNVAKKIELDTIYFLKGKEAGKVEKSSV